MKYSFIFLCVLFFSCKDNSKSPKTEKKVTTYYLIRHAEKDRSEHTQNPHLTAQGKERAQQWVSYFEDKNIDLIFSTNLHRTEETVHPTALRLGLGIHPYKAGNLYSDSFQRQTYGKNVLVVGHQDTTPALANKIIGAEKYKMIDAANHGNLYKITVDKVGKATATLKHIN